MKKLISLLLSVCILVSIAVIAAPAAFAADDRIDIPLIYLEGQGHGLYRNRGTEGQEHIYPLEIPENYINEKVEQYLPVFAEAFFTQEWSEFCVALQDCLIPLFKDIKLGPDGKPMDNSGILWTWTKEELTDTAVDGTYGIEDYIYRYDWRLDPWELAEELHRYIEDVMDVTSVREVAILGRCEGSSVVQAYLSRYNGEHIRECIFYTSASQGITLCNKAFTGELCLEPDGIERYVYDYELSDVEYIQDFIEAFVTMFNKTYGLDIASWAVNNVYKDIYLEIVPQIMIESFGTFPGYWSMVDAEHYDKAKETVFYGADLEKYAGLIQKIDNYHKNVRLKMDDNCRALNAKGIEFSNVAKYGYQMMPVSTDNDAVADNLCTLTASSMGATTCKVTEKFSDEYIENAKANGTFKYISPDLQVDASTCLFPDTTWIVKNLKHTEFPDDVHRLFAKIINTDGFTVFDSEEFPQYMYYDTETETISPLTTQNMTTTDRWEVSFFKAIRVMIESVFKMIKASISSK